MKSKWIIAALTAVLLLALPVVFAFSPAAEALLLRRPARDALRQTGLPTKFASPHVLTVGENITAFEVGSGDEDGESLRAELMDRVRTTPGWDVQPTTAAEIAQTLQALAPDAAFLLPRVDFQAHYTGHDGTRAWFDPESGLLLCFTPGTARGKNFAWDGMAIEGVQAIARYSTCTATHPVGASVRALIVPENQRDDLEKWQNGWFDAPVDPLMFTWLQQMMAPHMPGLYPSQDATFDRLMLQCDGVIADGEMDSLQFLRMAAEAESVAVGLYDRETGLLLCFYYVPGGDS